jgi:hypothetical protein
MPNLPVQSITKTLSPSLLGKKTMDFISHPKFKEYSLMIPVSLALTGIKVLMHGQAYLHEGFSKEDRRLLYVQEATRQTISTALWLFTLCTSYEFIIKRAFPKLSPMGQILASNVVSSLPDTFLRPFLTAKLSRYILGGDDRAAETLRPQPFSVPSKAPAASLRVLQQPQTTLKPVASPQQPTTPSYQSMGVMQPYFAQQQMWYPSASAYYPTLGGFYR